MGTMPEVTRGEEMGFSKNKSTYVFTSYALWKDLRFNSGIFIILEISVRGY